MELISCILLLVVLILLSFLEGWILMLLWNWLAPIFWSAAPELSYWQAMGIMLLLSIIGSFFRSSSSK